jgi:hypothetical protein
MNTDKRRWNPITLLVWGIVFIMIGPALMNDAVALKPVKDSSGAIVHKTDGRILFQDDTWGNIKINWLPCLLVLIGVLLIIFAIVRMIRSARRNR